MVLTPMRTLLIRDVAPATVIPLADAILCLDCAVLYSQRSQRQTCPNCSSQSAASVSRFLNRFGGAAR